MYEIIGGVGDTPSKGGAHEEDGASGKQHGRGAARGNTGIQGDTHLSVLQGTLLYTVLLIFVIIISD